MLWAFIIRSYFSFCNSRRAYEKQIPCGNDRKKSNCGAAAEKPQISPLRYVLSTIILGTPRGSLSSHYHNLVISTGAQRSGVRVKRSERDPRLGTHKPQISPLRCAPVEMTKLGVIANPALLNPIFIPLGGPQAHEHSGRDDKLGVTATPAVPAGLVSTANPFIAQERACLHGYDTGLCARLCCGGRNSATM